LGSCDRSQKDVQTAKEKDLLSIQKQEGGSPEFCERSVEERVYQTLKSPQMLPVFFVGKKDGSKWIVMDYHNLNSQTVKNNYPLPLIMELIDNMGSKKVFTKMDLRWGFNNVRIKERNE